MENKPPAPDLEELVDNLFRESDERMFAILHKIAEIVIDIT